MFVGAAVRTAPFSATDVDRGGATAVFRTRGTLAYIALFKVNTALREQEFVNLRWNWETPVPHAEFVFRCERQPVTRMGRSARWRPVQT